MEEIIEEGGEELEELEHHHHHHDHCCDDDDCCCHEHHHEHHHHEHGEQCGCGCCCDEDDDDEGIEVHQLAVAPTFSYHVLEVDCPHCALNCQNAVRMCKTVDDAQLIYATATLNIVKARGASDDERVIVIENSGVRGFDPAVLAEWEAGA